jgi:hypothetical protein
MRFLTGPDRDAYERLLATHASMAEEREYLKKLVARLDRRIEDLESQVGYERHRADQAIDNLLATRGLQPVMPPPAVTEDMNPWQEDPKELAELMKQLEWKQNA